MILTTSHFLFGFITNKAALVHLKRLHFRAVGSWCLEPHILLNIDDIGRYVSKSSVFHLGVLLRPFFITVGSLVVIEWVHAHHLAVIGVLTLQNATSDLFTCE